jgi:hypothetical protein
MSTNLSLDKLYNSPSIHAKVLCQIKKKIDGGIFKLLVAYYQALDIFMGKFKRWSGDKMFWRYVRSTEFLK